MWASTYSKRVELALRVKGIPYEYIEENVRDKSEELLSYNPVHKKIPIRVHNGKTIAESSVIPKCIHKTWTNHPRLLPEDPYQRAKVRFLTSYIQNQLFECMGRGVTKQGEEQEKAIKDEFQGLKGFEEGVRNFCLKEENLDIASG